MNSMYAAMIAAFIRWGLTIASQHVNVSDEQTNNIIAGAVALAPLVWSLVHQRRRRAFSLVDTAIKDAKAGV
jgi:hypothetical protein